MPTEPIEPMTPEKWAEFEAAHKALSSSASSAISREYSNLAQLSVTLLPAILAYHKRAEEIRQAAKQAVRKWDLEGRVSPIAMNHLSFALRVR